MGRPVGNGLVELVDSKSKESGSYLHGLGR